MRSAATLLAAASAFVALAATSAYATTEAKTTTPCTVKGSTAYAYFKAGATTTWRLRQHAVSGSYETDSDFGYAAVTGGTRYKVYVTDPNYVTKSLSVFDDTETVVADGKGHCDPPSAAVDLGNIPMPDGSGGPVVLPVVLPDTSAIFD